MSTSAFGTSSIKTGVTASTDAPLTGATIDVDLPASAEGFITPNAGYIEVKGKKVLGVSTSQGFFYSKDLGAAAVEVLEELVERGYAYATEATA